MAIGIRDLAFHQEVLDFLGRQPRIEVVSSSTRAMEQGPRSSGGANPDTRDADVMVVCPSVGGSLAGSERSGGTVVFVVAEEMTVPALRTAIELGAHGAFCWPEERADLARAIPLAGRSSDAASRTRGRVVAVLGARGGAGATFLASHLAAAFARSGLRSVLVDMDPDFGDVTAALGLVEEDGVNSIEDLLPVIDELGPDHVARALTSHEEGFDILLSRPPVARADSGSAGGTRRPEAIPTGLYGASVALLAV
ncbi:MAG: AAA family ATPase, partial [Thermoplasmata archaeon]|nr:AAA family ATPase [Thermoplasmata archaeon]